MRRFLTFAGLALALAPSQASAARCVEDSPCWNWASMGDHKRGVATTGGRRLVVGPVRFCRLDRDGLIDWSVSPRLRGDKTAREAC